MYCKTVELQNFRNIKNSKIEFSSGVNVIMGQNAQGKTNALEAIYLCASGRSHRTSKDKNFINFDKEMAKITLVYEDSRRENTLELVYSTKSRRFCAKNGVHLKKLSEFVGNFKAVIFTPEHLSIVKSAPSVRRSFVDSAISQISTEYLLSAQRYAKILESRNKIFQNPEKHSARTVFEMSEPYTQMLSKEGEFMGSARKRYIDALSLEVNTILEEMTGGVEHCSIEYNENFAYSELMKQYRENFHKELAAGVTLIGIHKDDIIIKINGFEARSFASQGQQRSIALAMKLAEGSLTRQKTGEEPVYLLDDVLSELDARRREYIISCLEGKQVILTSCESIDTEDARIIYCENGSFKKQKKQPLE